MELKITKIKAYRRPVNLVLSAVLVIFVLDHESHNDININQNKYLKNTSEPRASILLSCVKKEVKARMTVIKFTRKQVLHFYFQNYIYFFDT
jgi:hypothetical protein